MIIRKMTIQHPPITIPIIAPIEEELDFNSVTL